MILHGGEAPVVDDEDVGASEASEELRIGAVCARQRQLVGEPGGPPIDGAVPLAARLLRERAGAGEPRAFLGKWC